MHREKYERTIQITEQKLVVTEKELSRNLQLEKQQHYDEQDRLRKEAVCLTILSVQTEAV